MFHIITMMNSALSAEIVLEYSLCKQSDIVTYMSMSNTNVAERHSHDIVTVTMEVPMVMKTSAFTVEIGMKCTLVSIGSHDGLKHHVNVMKAIMA